eukprot:TRINITY_DN17134_c0_g3_i2.p1 TRINITY_DN17134_c0_g3~~TRINITY_DN17134_c0_g3_i2.p1  ORF type:complete len:121 (-),score=14.79 TRINITY_DN17134_c0_g3_i2:23-361(-)
MIRRPPRSTHCISSAASDVYKRQLLFHIKNVILKHSYLFTCHFSHLFSSLDFLASRSSALSKSLSMMGLTSAVFSLVSWLMGSSLMGSYLSLIHICRCRRYAVCRSRWSPYH